MSSTHQSNHNGHAEGNRAAAKSGTFSEMIADQPVTSLAVAAAAGFIIGGGARRSGGWTILALLIQIAMREGSGESSSLGDLLGAALGIGTED
jgi:hypothetical protein